MNFKKLLLLPVLMIVFIPKNLTVAQDFDHLFTDGLNLNIKTELVYDGWNPDESYNLQYYTEGFQHFKFEAKLTHDLKLFKELKFEWETNFHATHQEELLQVYSAQTPIEKAYKKIKIIAGMGEKYGDFNPWTSNSVFDLSYSKEAFFIEVTPTVPTLIYAPFESNNFVELHAGETLGMFTKFEELQGTFNTGGFALLPFIVSSLTGGTVTDVLQMDGFDTRLGAYYSTFQKPYMVDQVSTHGTTTGESNYIYAAKFNAVGLVEKYGYYGKIFTWDMQMNYGAAWVKLRQDQVLKDSESLMFFHYKLGTGMGFHIPLFESRVNISIKGSIDWGFMYGGTYDDETETIVTQSYLNDDLIYKLLGSVTVNLF